MDLKSLAGSLQGQIYCLGSEVSYPLSAALIVSLRSVLAHALADEEAKSEGDQTLVWEIMLLDPGLIPVRFPLCPDQTRNAVLGYMGTVNQLAEAASKIDIAVQQAWLSISYDSESDRFRIKGRLDPKVYTWLQRMMKSRKSGLFNYADQTYGVARQVTHPFLQQQLNPERGSVRSSPVLSQLDGGRCLTLGRPGAQLFLLGRGDRLFGNDRFSEILIQSSRLNVYQTAQLLLLFSQILTQYRVYQARPQ